MPVTGRFSAGGRCFLLQEFVFWIRRHVFYVIGIRV